MTSPLHELALLHGLETSFTDAFGKTREAAPESLLLALAALGAPVAKEQDVPDALRARRRALARRPCEPVTVAWDGAPVAIELHVPAARAAAPLACRVELEDGSVRAWTAQPTALPAPLPEGQDHAAVSVLLPELPPGTHRLEAEAGGWSASSVVLAAPRHVWRRPEGERSWGVFLPLHALHSKTSWGAGHLGDLRELVEWTGARGGGVVGTLPLLPTFLDEPFSPSPYAPVSRLFWNELFLEVERLPGLDACAEARAILERSRAARAELREAELVDYRRQYALLRPVLDALARRFFAGDGPGSEPYRRFLAGRPDAGAYARFRAVTEKLRAPWGAWPARLRDGELRVEDCDEAAERTHLFAQWQLHEQMTAVAAAARGIGPGLYLDLPLGSHPSGYDLWHERAAFLPGMSTGAPPDPLGPQGQNWGFPPPHPERTREDGYRYFRASLAHHLRAAGVLRIDHALGLHRLLWIPDGEEASRGVYGNYRSEELYAVLALESHRHRALLVAEDLGTIPAFVREELDRRRVLRHYVAIFEAGSDPARALSPPPDNVVASLNTHDLPPFAAFWNGRDAELRRELGLWTAGEAEREKRGRAMLRTAVAEYLRRRRFLNGPDDAPHALRALLGFLGASAAPLVLVNLEDLWLETGPQNVPGTIDEWPNWRRRALHGLEDFRERPEVVDALADLDKWRRGKRAPAEPSLLSDLDLHLFNQGTHRRLFERLGAHPVDGGTWFGVWAPGAERVSVVGDFNGWRNDAHPLRPRGSSGLWEGFRPGVGPGAHYKFHVVSRFKGYRADKRDPFARYCQVPPETASIVWDPRYEWGDAGWMARRAERQAPDRPLSIYEGHLGSWMRGEGDRMPGYRELAERLPEHVAALGFTHVELLPVMEHPFYGSWGYQCTGFFAPTSRYGTPQDFMALVDAFHRRGIGVILDWVPSHFPSDEHGLGYFDGTHLYEHADPRQGFHPDWKTLIFNYGAPEVRSFLISSALHWLDTFHADGLRVDAVASMLYLDYSRQEGGWVPNRHGGRENLEAIAFLRELNEAVHESHPGALMIAEESTSWPMVSRPAAAGGLGFDLKWDMGWMHDTLKYFARDPIHRKFHHQELTFRQLYAQSESFLLPLSHDEVVHLKSSLLGKMPGDEWRRFANLRLLYAWQYAQSGKKLLFMGSELAPPGEWNHDRGLDWHLLERPLHAGVRRLVADLNRLYAGEPAMHERDQEAEGFEWIDCHDAEASVLALLRRGRSTDDLVLAALNFTPNPRSRWRVGVPRGGFWREVLNTDAREYGGSGVGNWGGLEAEATPAHGRPFSLVLELPPLGAVFLKSGT
jgi:alpha-1,4-glucan:alpha-1,4-glucan 6-glycosyltransferase/4-alpha-glucanotransferase